MKNTSHAVMAQRHEPHDSLDDFPTPPWATRAVIEHIILPALGDRNALKSLIVREPACNRGHMARPLAEYFNHVYATDIHHYGYEGHANTEDYLYPWPMVPAHWTFLNPPFKSAQKFIERSFETPQWQGTAALVRSSFLEGVERYRELYLLQPPVIVAQFSERVVMTRGIVRNPNKSYIDALGLPRRPSTATSYAWLLWLRGPVTHTRLMWIPPCRRQLERKGDYD